MHDDLNIDRKLQKIVNDNSSGSTDLLVSLISYFSEAPEDLRSHKLLDYLSGRFSPFGIITNFLSRAKIYSSSPEKEILNFLREEKENIFKEINSLSEKYFSLFEMKNNLTTISNSFFLRNFLILLRKKNKRLTISVSESRPQFEGRLLAESLATEKISVNLFTEAQTPEFVEKSDAVLIGADKILPDGSVVNKVGSRNLAIAAKYFSKPFYVLGAKNKISNAQTFDKGVHKPDEIYQSVDKKMIRVTNYYFERVEASLVTAILHI